MGKPALRSSWRRWPDNSAGISVNQANYYEIERGEFIIEHQWRTGQGPSMVGRHMLADFGERAVAILASGEPIRLDDTREVEGSGAFAAIRMLALISVPLHRSGEWVAGLHVHQHHPRIWTDEEVALVREVAERAWVEIERAREEPNLRESEARFRTLAETIPQLVWTSIADAQWTYASRQWTVYTGQSEAEAIGLGWLDAVHPDDRVFTLAAVGGAEAAGHLDLEHRLRRSDGSYRWFQTRATPLRGEPGAPVQWFGTCTDVDEVRRAQDPLRNLNETLEMRVREAISERDRVWAVSRDMFGVATSDGVFFSTNRHGRRRWAGRPANCGPTCSPSCIRTT